MNKTYLLTLLLSIFLCSCGGDTVIENRPKNVKGVRNYKKEFNDLNDAQLIVAKKHGIFPLDSRDDLEKVKRRLEKIESCDLYTVDKLTHSVPYLVPRANKLLKDISKNFSDSLSAKGLNRAKPIITSVLRTKKDIKSLRKTNINSTENSTHMYGTTFDITWKRYDKVKREGGKVYIPANDEHLKRVMAEVLRDLRDRQKCYVKYEVKQGCFHITTR